MSGSVNFISPYNLGNLLAPIDGTTHGAKCAVTLAANQKATLQISSLQQVMGNFQPQSILVDNSGNTFDLKVTELVFGLPLLFPAGSINWINFPAVNNAIFEFSSSGSINANLAFFDFPALPFSTQNSVNSPSANVNITNPSVPVNITNGSVSLSGTVPYNDASVTSTGASQQLVASNNNRKYLLIGAPSSADIWVNFAGGTAGASLTGCFKIAAGGFYESNIYVPSNVVNVFCATNSLIIPCTVG